MHADSMTSEERTSSSGAGPQASVTEAWLAAIRNAASAGADLRDPTDREAVEAIIDWLLSSTSGYQSTDSDNSPVLLHGRRLGEIFRRLNVPPKAIARLLGTLWEALKVSDREGQPGKLEETFGALCAATAQGIAEIAPSRGAPTQGLDQFTRIMAHGLKNPIGAAQGAAAMLLDDAVMNDPAQRKRFAEMIVRNLRRAVDLISDLRVIVADGETASRPQSLASIAENVLHEVEGAARERGVHVSLLEPMPEANIDMARGTLVLMNIVWNSIKYSDPAKDDRWARICVEATPDDTWQCSVSDNGVGIPEEDRQRVFERFERGHDHEATGSGLGLAIAREALAQMGGRIWLDSEVGKGTTFYFSWPRHRAESA
jgi:signal transduction histidine kinase